MNEFIESLETKFGIKPTQRLVETSLVHNEKRLVVEILFEPTLNRYQVVLMQEDWHTGDRKILAGAFSQ